MTSERNKRMIQKYGGRVMPFRDLPAPARLAIAYYMAVNGDAWELPPEYLSRNVSLEEIRRTFRSTLRWFTQKYGSERFGYVEIPMDALAEAIMQDKEMLEAPFRDFDEYHQWYISQLFMPKHPKTGRWPVILSSYPEETLQDGWHRLHDYYRQDAKVIPAVYYP